MSVIIQHKRGTASQWTSLNPTLDAGEVGWESDTNKFKIGIGSTAWNSLPYATLTPSELSSGYARLAFPNAFTVGGHTITNDAAGTVPLLIKTASGQTAGFMEFRDSGNNLQTIFTAGASIRTAGNLVAGNTSTALGQLTSYASSASTIGAVIRGAAGQTSSLQEWQDSSSTVLTSITSAGNLNTGQIRSGTTSGLAQITGIAGNATTIGMIIRGAASQTANLTEWQNSAGTVLSRVDKNGSISAPYFGPSGTGLLGYLDWTTNSPIFWTGNGSVVGAIIRGHGSGGSSTQTANLQEWQTWNGTTASTVLFVGSGGQLRAGGSIAGTGWAINNQVYGASVIPLVVRGATSQSANLQEWQNSAGTTLSFLDSAGNFRGNVANHQYRAFNEDSTRVKFANWYTSDSDQFGQGQNWNELWFGAINSNSPRRIGFYLNLPNATTSPGATNADMYVTTTGIGINTSVANVAGQLHVTSGSSTRIGQIIRGALNQSGDLLQVQNNTPQVMSKIDALGKIYAPGGTTIYDYTSESLGGTDTAWKKFVEVTCPTGLYTGASYELEVVDSYDNYGLVDRVARRFKFYVKITRSGGVQDDVLSASVTGPSVDYVRVVKTSSSLYEIQIRQPDIFRVVSFKIRRVSQNNTSESYTPSGKTYGSLDAGSTTGTIYVPVNDSTTVANFLIDNFSQLSSNIMTIQPLGTLAATTPLLRLTGSSTQNSNYIEVRNNGGTILSRISNDGSWNQGPDSTRTFVSAASGRIQVVSSNSTAPAILVQPFAANYADYDNIEYRTNTGTIIGGVGVNAQIYSGLTTPITSSTGGATTATSGTGTVATVTTTSAHNLAVGDRVTIAGITPTGYNGTYIVTATPSTTQLSYNNTTTGSQTVAGTVSVDSQTSIQTRSAATAGLIVRGAASQANDLQQWQNSSATTRAYVTADGSFLTSGTLTTMGNLRVAGLASTGGGSGVIGIANAATAPTTNPTGGGVLYVNSGALAYRGTSGSAATIVNADGTTPYPTLSGNNTFTGNQIWNNSVNLGPGLNTSVGFEIGYTGGAATTPYIDFHSGATAVDFDSRIIASGGNGSNAGGTLTYNAAAHNFAGVITSQNSVTSQAGLALSGASSPLTLNGSTGTTGQVLTSAGAGTTPTWSSSFISTTSSYFAGHNPEGRLMYNTYLTNDMANARLRGSAVTATQNGSPYTISNANWDAMFDGTASFFNISPTSGFTFPLVITVPLPRTLTYGAWVGLSFGSTTFRANSITIEVFSLDSSSWVTIFTTTTNTSEDIFAAVSGLANSNATGINQVRYTISAPNSTQLRLQHLWAYNFNSDMWSQTMMPRGGGSFYGPISATTVSDAVVMSVRGAASGGASIQTADLQRWQTWDGTTTTTRARIDSGGNLKANNVATLNSIAQMAESNSGALFVMGRATAQAASPGLNYASLYFRDGTTSGTLRLATRTGASGIEETIVDNLSSTGSTAGAQFTGAGGVRTTGLINTNSSQYGNTILFAAPASTTYYLLATLPISSAGTYDHIRIDGIGGGWGSGDYSTYSFTFANRNAFSYKYELSNRDVMANFKLRAYSQVDGSVQIWASGEASAFLKFAYNISSAQNVTTVANPVATTTAPSGTVVFDSSNTATYPPVRSIYGGMSIFNTTTGTTPLLVRGVSGQTADLVKIQNNTPTDLFAISSAGLITAKVVSNAANQSRGIMLSNTSDLWQSGLYLKSDGSGNPRLTLLAPTGGMGEAVSIDSAAKVGFNNIAPTGQVDITTASTTRVPLIIRPQASQTADLLQVRNSADNANLARIDSSGKGIFDVLNAPNGAFFGNLTSQPGGGAYLAVQGYAAGHRPLLVRGFGATTANLVDYQDGSGVVISGVNGVGQIFTGSTTPILTASGGTIQSIAAGANPLVTMASAHGFTTGDLVTLAGTTGGTYNGTFVVASTPASTTFTITSALTTGQAAAGGTASNPAQLSVTVKSPGTIGAIIRGAASQTSNLLELQSNAGVAQSWFSGDGTTLSALGIYSRYIMSATAGTAATVPLTVKGAASQSANLQEWQNSAGNVIASVNSSGDIGTTAAVLAGTSSWLSASLNVRPLNQGIVGAVIRGVASQTANLTEWQDSTGAVQTSISPIGRLWTSQRISINDTGFTGYFTLFNANPSAVATIIRGASGQSSDLLQIQSNTPSTLFSIGSDGTITHNAFFQNFNNMLTSGRMTVGLNTLPSGVQFGVYSGATTNVGAIVRGASGQTADLQQWQSWDGTTATTVLSVSPSGFISSNSGANFNSALTQIGAANSGGQITMQRQTAAPSNPGANIARIYFRDGTTAGTLKLIARTGASGVEETIVDNLSSTGSTAGAQFVGAGGINTAGSLQTTAGLNLSGAAATVTLNGSVGTSGQVLTSAGAGATPTWTTVSGGTFTGGTLTSNLTLDDGTTTSAPLTFVSGTNLTTPASGAIEYDGTVFYQTSNTNPGRALNTQNYYYVSSADYAPDYSTSASVQSMLGATTRGITVAAGTTYEYEFYTTVQHQYITNTGITGTYALTSSTVSGSPVVSTVHQIDYGSNTTSFTTATTMSTIRTTGSVVFSAAISSGSRYNFLRAKGVIRVTGTGTAELYPGLSLSGIAGDNIWTIQNGTVFKLTPIGNGTVTQVGTWA